MSNLVFIRPVFIGIFAFMTLGCSAGNAADEALDAAVSPDEGAAPLVAKDNTSRLTAISELNFTRRDKDGAAPGFDLDGVVSVKDNTESCGHADFVTPAGDEGIDNQLAILTPALDAIGLSAVQDLIQGAIEDGGLLIVFQIQGIDDRVNDEDVSLTLRLGAGTPLLGTNGILLSGQTFHVHADDPDLAAPRAWIADGVVQTDPFDFKLPIRVFDQHYALEIKEGRIRARLGFDGGLTEGVLGGGVPLSNLMDIAVQADKKAKGILEGVSALIANIGDLKPDANGECQQMSAALSFNAVSMFFFQEALPQ